MKAGSPRVLLVEDDPISREVLTLAIAGVPADVVGVASLAQARAALADGPFAAWMVDAHLPDGPGADLLALRPAATAALAHTASTDVSLTAGLLSAGFIEVLVKPLGAADVQAALRRVLGNRPHGGAVPATAGTPLLWDDAIALRALAGHAGNVAGLRGLFVRELEPALQRLQAAFGQGDIAGLQAELHRLKASCGFVGAARLGAAVAMASAHPLDVDAHAHLHATGHATLQAPYAGPVSG